MFPAQVTDRRYKPKSYVYAVRTFGAEKAWPLERFEGGKVIHDKLGALDVVLIGDEATRTVRAYRSGGKRFKVAARTPAGITKLTGPGDTAWTIEEASLVGPGGEKLDRLAGHIGYWFAWQNFRASAPVATR